MPHTRRPYPSDLTDEEWALLRPLLESPEKRGRPSGPPDTSLTPSSTY
jgi:transposase